MFDQCVASVPKYLHFPRNHTLFLTFCLPTIFRKRTRIDASSTGVMYLLAFLFLLADVYLKKKRGTAATAAV